ncbi:MAG: AAA family ATPase [Deltaproteobacteria bacterium]|nr:AAA family ATPase [Deltaproteobacteria bacterium]
MLTRIQVEGFKSLLNVDVRLGPFTAFVGENGAGKSNLFDALLFLSLLMKHPIPEAAALLRDASGRSMKPSALFTRIGAHREPELRIAVDLLVPSSNEDDYGVRADASITSMRYTLALQVDDERTGQLSITHESLEPLKVTETRAGLGFESAPAFRTSAVTGRRPSPIVSCHDGVVKIHQEGHQGRAREVPLARSSRTVLQSVNGDFPSALAARRELESWTTLSLEPSKMRSPSSYRDPRKIDAFGGGLPAALERMRLERGEVVLAEIANQLAELLPAVRRLRVVDDARTETFTVEVCGTDGAFHPARALSDGTLRFLVLSALAVDGAATGVLCFEEPENGMHPDRIPAMVSLVRDLAVDPSLAVDETNPLRQVLMNTHSPLVYKEVDDEDIVFVELATVVKEGEHGEVTRVGVPAGTWRQRSGQAAVAPSRAKRWRQMTFDSIWAAEE